MMLLTTSSSAGPRESMAELLDLLRDQAASEQGPAPHAALQGWLTSFISRPWQQRAHRPVLRADCLL